MASVPPSAAALTTKCIWILVKPSQVFNWRVRLPGDTQLSSGLAGLFQDADHVNYHPAAHAKQGISMGAYAQLNHQSGGPSMTTTWPLPDSPRNMASPARMRAFIAQIPKRVASLTETQPQRSHESGSTTGRAQ